MHTIRDIVNINLFLIREFMLSQIKHKSDLTDKVLDDVPFNFYRS